MAGKIRLATTPWLNHSWHVPLYVSVRGLTTGLIPDARRSFELEFDLLGDVLAIRTTGGQEMRVSLIEQSLSTFYGNVVRALNPIGIQVALNEHLSELPERTLFSNDHELRLYDGNAARAFWRALVQANRVFHLFRTRFTGKCSPVHLFWGSFDLAVTRFSGRKAPLHPGGVPYLPDAVVRDAYSQEVSSAGFWPGSGAVKTLSFYSYASPAPSRYSDAHVEPAAARFDSNLGEFLLPYDAVRPSPDPDATLMAFLQSTYEAAANLAIGIAALSRVLREWLASPRYRRSGLWTQPAFALWDGNPFLDLLGLQLREVEARTIGMPHISGCLA